MLSEGLSPRIVGGNLSCLRTVLLTQLIPAGHQLNVQLSGLSQLRLELLGVAAVPEQAGTLSVSRQSRIELRQGPPGGLPVVQLNLLESLRSPA